MKEEYVKRCPYCGNGEFIEAYQDGYGAVTGVKNYFGGVKLHHTVCRKCGSVVRSFVKDPEKLLRRKDRRKEE